MSKLTTALDTSCSTQNRKQKSGLKTKDSSTATSSKSVSPSRRLTQEELNAWWPFERLDPKRFPKPNKNLSFEEDALL